MSILYASAAYLSHQLNTAGEKKKDYSLQFLKISHCRFVCFTPLYVRLNCVKLSRPVLGTSKCFKRRYMCTHCSQAFSVNKMQTSVLIPGSC